MKERKTYLDLLKFMGLSFFILAHAECDNLLLMQLREFDVPMITFISGILSLDSCRREHSAGRYILKRVKRLIIPAYIFLTGFFLLYHLVWLKIGGPYFTLEVIRNSYFLSTFEGMGFVWIIRVYILCAVVTPLFVSLMEKLPLAGYCSVLALIYACYEIAYAFERFNHVKFVSEILWYMIPYGFVSALGMASNQMSRKTEVLFGAGFLGLFFALAAPLCLSRGWVLTSEYKYPPRMYYLSYALGVSFLLDAYFKHRNLKLGKLCGRCVSFVSSNSLWIYFLHIPFIMIFQRTLPELHWFPRFLLLYSCTLLVVFAKNRILPASGAAKRGFVKYLYG